MALISPKSSIKIFDICPSDWKIKDIKINTSEMSESDNSGLFDSKYVSIESKLKLLFNIDLVEAADDLKKIYPFDIKSDLVKSAEAEALNPQDPNELSGIYKKIKSKSEETDEFSFIILDEN